MLIEYRNLPVSLTLFLSCDTRRLLGVLRLGIMLLVVTASANVLGQKRKPPRARPPVFERGDFKDVFFEDPKAQLKGEPPSARRADSADKPAETTGNSPSVPSNDPMAWHNLVSPESLEDLIKGTKLRLDRIVTTPAAFSGGGFVAARREFSLLALLFAVVEQYPGEVRWKPNSAVARELMTRVAANSKVGSIQTYREAKNRMLDLGDLVNGSKLSGEAKSETDWSNLMDRTPLMQLLGWAQKDYINPHSASASSFSKNKDDLRQYAELVALLGKTSLQEEMPDATDDDYKRYANEMIEQARQIVLAVESENADAARLAAGQLGQSCSNCHDDFR